jgi:LacI family transcriptional regulator
MDTILYFQPQSVPCVPHQFAGVREVALRRGAHVQVVYREPAAELVAELAELWHALGAVVECSSRTTPIDASAFGTMPVVLLNADPSQRPETALSVCHDSAATARVAARELLSLGLAHFAFFPHPEPLHWSLTRERAFAEAIRMHGNDSRTFRAKAARHSAPENTFPTEWQAELREFIRQLPKPCGVFAANDTVAAEVLTAARFARVTVPGDLAVLGVDNDEKLCEECEPPLSSIEPDSHRGGMLAASLIFEVAGNGGKPSGARRLEYGPLRVVQRESTRLLAVPDKCAADAIALIRREACAGLRASAVAALFPCSRRMADIRFRNAVGRGILAEIHAVQLETAKRLLETTDIPLKALSDFCGFENPNSLRKFFRRETGTTLSAWRASHRPW